MVEQGLVQSLISLGFNQTLPAVLTPWRQQDVPGGTGFLCLFPFPGRVLVLGWGLSALLKAASVWAH